MSLFRCVCRNVKVCLIVCDNEVVVACVAGKHYWRGRFQNLAQISILEFDRTVHPEYNIMPL